MRGCSPRDWDIAVLTWQEGLKECGYNHGRNLVHSQVSSAFQASARQQIACAMENYSPLASVTHCLPVCLCGGT